MKTYLNTRHRHMRTHYTKIAFYGSDTLKTSFLADYFMSAITAVESQLHTQREALMQSASWISHQSFKVCLKLLQQQNSLLSEFFRKLSILMQGVLGLSS